MFGEYCAFPWIWWDFTLPLLQTQISDGRRQTDFPPVLSNGPGSVVCT